MPAIAAPIAAFIVGASEGTAFVIVESIILIAINVGLSAISKALSGSQKPSNSGLQNQARDVTVRGTVQPEQLVYGQVRSGGHLAYANLIGAHNEILVYVIVWAGHQCDSIVEYQVDNVRIRRTDLSGGGPLYSVTHTHFTGTSGLQVLGISEYLGTSTQTVDSTLTGGDTAWDSTHKGLGLCYSIFFMTADDKVWFNGAPQDLFAVVKGRRLYDARLDSTNGGSGSQRANDATTWTWSNNAALATRDAISGGSITYDIATPNKKLLGGGELDSRIDDAYFIAAANHCDEACTVPIPFLVGTVTWTHSSTVITGIGTQFTYEFPGGTIKILGPDSNFYTVSTVDSDTQITLTAAFTGTTTANTVTQWFTSSVTTTTEARFTADCLVSLDQTRGAILTTLLSACIGHLSYTGGKYRLFVGVYDSPTISLNADDIVGKMTTVTNPNDEDLYNLVGGTFYDEQRGWQQSSFPPQTQSSYQTDDGDLYPRNIDLLATRGFFRAQRIANVHLQQSRNKITFEFERLSPKAFQIGEYETFNLNVPEYGYVNQICRCLKWTFLPDGFISISARIEGSSLYSDLASGNYQLPRFATGAGPAVTAPAAPNSLTLTSFPTYIKAVVGFAATPPAGTLIQVWEYTSNSPFSSSAVIARGTDTFVFNIPKRDTTTRYYWATATYNGQISTNFPASTGTSSAADLVQTQDAQPTSMTDTHAAQATNVTITQQAHTPILLTNFVSVTFTPAISCVLRCTVTGMMKYVDSGGGFPNMQLAVYDSSATAPWVYNVTPPQVASATAWMPFSQTQNINCTGGASITISAGASKFAGGDTLTIVNTDLSVEEIKR